jgi:hypothetical protein
VPRELPLPESKFSRVSQLTLLNSWGFAFLVLSLCTLVFWWYYQSERSYRLVGEIVPGGGAHGLRRRRSPTRTVAPHRGRSGNSRGRPGRTLASAAGADEFGMR